MKITEHAIVRYMERFHELDVEQVKREIAARIPSKDGNHLIEGTDMLCVVRAGTLVTMYKHQPKPKPAKKPKPVPIDEKRAVIEEMWAGYNRFAQEIP